MHNQINSVIKLASLVLKLGNQHKNLNKKNRKE